MLVVYVDADACPVKQEIYKVARRHELEVVLVANSWMNVPDSPSVRLEVVAEGCDAADDWIVEQVEADDIVITADILLASRCLQAGALVIGTNGERFTEDGIGHAVATRNLLADLRGAGEETRGPAPLTQRDRSRFLQEFDQMIRDVRRRRARG